MANLGATYIQLGNPQAARTALTEALRRGPEADTYLALGDLELTDGKYDVARQNYEEAAKLKPSYHLIYRNIGDCYAMTGDARKVMENYGKAAQLLSASLATNPQDGYNWATLAFYHAKLGDTRAAESDIRESEKRKTEDVESRFLVTQALALMGRKQEALKLLLWCMDKGLSPEEVNLALDLKDLRKDPRYVARLGTRSGDSAPSSN
jgi:tetratricopeptide (TPR) repeat protein